MQNKLVTIVQSLKSFYFTVGVSLYRAQGKGSSWLSQDWINQGKNADSMPPLSLEGRAPSKIKWQSISFHYIPTQLPWRCSQLSSQPKSYT